MIYLQEERRSGLKIYLTEDFKFTFYDSVDRKHYFFDSFDKAISLAISLSYAY